MEILKRLAKNVCKNEAWKKCKVKLKKETGFTLKITKKSLIKMGNYI